MALLALSIHATNGAVQMPVWFSDNMVLQTNTEYGARSFLSGRANAGERVTVEFEPTYNAKEYTAVADATGAWEACPQTPWHRKSLSWHRNLMLCLHTLLWAGPARPTRWKVPAVHGPGLRREGTTGGGPKRPLRRRFLLQVLLLSTLILP